MQQTNEYVPSTTEGLSEAEFVARYPFPVVAVGLIQSQAGEFQFLTMPDGTGPLLDRPGAKPVLGVELIRLYKRASNPFAQWITVGRAQNNDIVVRSTDMSKFHAYYSQREDGGWALTDSNSTNGSFLGGERLLPNRPYPIENGQSVFLASTQMTLLQAKGLYQFLYQLGGSAPG
jgi:hypothetical protein